MVAEKMKKRKNDIVKFVDKVNAEEMKNVYTVNNI
jgi:hypothetical protein